jgi:lysophospholipase L1-like esterase
MRTLLCYGDSNTWGYEPGTGSRYTRDVRWPGLLAALLGDEWYVVEEGLNGRTTTLDSPVAPGKNGLTYLVPCLYSHAPLDVVVIFLGNNDLADRYSLPAVDVARAAARLAVVVQRFPECGADGTPPRVILVCPPPLEPNAAFEAGFTAAVAKSQQLARWFREEAELAGCDLVDLAGVTRYSDVDGIHLEPDGHRAVAEAVARALAR